jgi:hypothetical protein
MRLNDGRLGAKLGRALRTSQSAAAAADTDEIEYLLGHGLCSTLLGRARQ